MVQFPNNNNGYGFQQPYNQQTYQPQFYYQPQPQFQQRLPQEQKIENICGKIVNSLDAINVNDIPMDGNVAFFPMQDMSKIFVKSWNAKTGLIDTIIYEPQIENNIKNELLDNNEINANSNFNNVILERFDQIENKIDQIEKSLPKKTTRTTKKESET